MDKETLREYCLSFPHATERVQWGNDLLFCVADKMFAVTNLEPAEIRSLSIKCDPETFAELTEREGIEPAAYLAQYRWISIRNMNALKPRELRDLIRASYDMVYARLPAGVKRRMG
ncbi:MAG TPA: MmcQ/YjbR family DNA-binding protein [Candidatus Kapabacteria bacterium]|nr:MmcQ/YjbR family DNA-binding protein [Candidatus Kapabacteria bacterium]